MPFHINYSGPAQVSAFMRVEKYKRESVDSEKRDDETKEIEPTKNHDVEMKEAGTPITRPVLSGAPSTDSVMTEATAVAESQGTIVNDNKHSPLPPLEDEDKRFISTFRGRSIHGLTISLPVGYSGLVLRAEANPHEHAGVEKKKEDDVPKSTKGKGKAAASKTKAGATTAKDEAKGKPRGRLTRSAAPKRVEEPIIIEDEEQEKKEEDNDAPELETGNGDDAGEPLPDSKPVKQLVPTAQFSSFTLWHADRPVDKGNDEYARTLKEWLALAHEVRSCILFFALVSDWNCRLIEQTCNPALPSSLYLLSSSSLLFYAILSLYPAVCISLYVSTSFYERHLPRNTSHA